MGQVGTGGSDADGTSANSSRRIDVADLICIYAGHAEREPGPYTLRELKAIAETAWQKTARIEAAVRDGLTPRKDKRPWDSRTFNPFTAQQMRPRSMTGEDVRRIAGQFKRVRQVSVRDVKVQKNEQ